MNTYAAALYEGTFSVGLDKKFIRIPRNGNPAKGALKISLNPFLIKTGSKNILFDCGIGEFGEDTGPEIIRKNLEEHQLHDFDITDIFITHLHYDHIGGLAHRQNGYPELTFPEAKIWVSGNEWEKTMAQDTYYDDEKSAFISFVAAKGDIHFLEDDDQPYPEVQVRKTGGHTEFHQVLLFNNGNQKYMQAGDVIGTRGQATRKFFAKYDFDAKESQRQRELLAKMAFDEGYVILAYHEDQTPLFKLTDYDENSGYTSKPVNGTESA